jgi:hypothetical protein
MDKFKKIYGLVFGGHLEFLNHFEILDSPTSKYFCLKSKVSSKTLKSACSAFMNNLTNQTPNIIIRPT